MGVYKRGRVWYIDYPDQFGRRHQEAISRNKRLAEKVLAKKETEVTEGKFLDVKKVQKIRFDEMTTMYIEKYARVNKKSWTRDATCAKNLCRHFSGKTLNQITVLDIDDYKSERIKQVSPRTVNIEIKFLKAMFNKAIVWGKALKNPTDKLTLFKENNKRTRYLAENEIRELLDNCSDRLRAIIIMALNTGMRKGEILKLKWENVDLSNKTLYITETKGGEDRNISINDMLCKSIRNLEERKNGPYVFSNKEGKPYVDIRKGFMTALRRAGIEDFRFHDLRHTFASHLVMVGVDLITVKELLGHKSIEMTMRYAHLSSNHKREATERLGGKMQKLVTNRLQEGQDGKY